MHRRRLNVVGARIGELVRLNVTQVAMCCFQPAGGNHLQTVAIFKSQLRVQGWVCP